MGQQGVTLIQMMYALGLTAALTQLGLPAYSAMSVSLQREASAQNLAQALRSARSEALLRNQRVSLTAFEGDWSKGWRMSADDEGLLHEYRASGKVRVVGNQPLARQVHFSGLGVPLQAGGAFQAGTLHVCESPGTRSLHQVVLSRTGRVSLRHLATDQPLCAAAGSDQ